MCMYMACMVCICVMLMIQTELLTQLRLSHLHTYQYRHLSAHSVKSVVVLSRLSSHSPLKSSIYKLALAPGALVSALRALTACHNHRLDMHDCSLASSVTVVMTTLITTLSCCLIESLCLG